MTEQERFEAEFPIPRDCIRCGDGYAATTHGAWAAHKYADKYEGWKARAALDVPVIPEGFALVPIRPNQDMCTAGQWKAREWPKFPLRIAPIYQAMLDAAPKVAIK